MSIKPVGNWENVGTQMTEINVAVIKVTFLCLHFSVYFRTGWNYIYIYKIRSFFVFRKSLWKIRYTGKIILKICVLFIWSFGDITLRDINSWNRHDIVKVARSLVGHETFNLVSSAKFIWAQSQKCLNIFIIEKNWYYFNLFAFWREK